MILTLSTLPALAVDINVDSTCSLANAIRSANGDAQVAPMDSCETGAAGSGTAGADRILLAASLTLPANTVLPTITSRVTITSDDGVSHRHISRTYFETSAESHLTLDKIHILNGGNRNAQKPALVLGGPATLNSVLISSSQLTGIRGYGANADYEFTNVVIWNSATEWNWPNAILAQAGTYTITNLVVANMFGGFAMFRIDEGASITLRGCKLIYDTATNRVWGAGRFRDRTGGSICTTAMQIASYGYNPEPAREAPPALACGFPDARWMNLPANSGVITYTLNSDCTLTRQLIVPYGAKVVIQSPPGERHTISLASNNFRFLGINGQITLRNVDVVAPTHASLLYAFIRLMPTGVLIVENSKLSTGSNTGFQMAIRNDAGDVRLNRATIQGFKSSHSVFASAIMNVGAGRIQIRDSVIRDNTEGAGAINLFHNAGYLYLLGMNTFTGNTRQSGACAAGYDPRGICDAHSLICEGEACLPRPPPPSDEEESGSWSPPPIATATPKPQTCLTLPAHIVVSNITQSTQCQQVGRDGIGNAEVLAAGFRDGVDIWGWVLPDTQVCFAVSSGSFRFLDAATSPRAVSELPAHGLNGMICTKINRAGTVALMPGPPAPAATAMPPPSQSLSGCMVRTNYMLNFRAAPGGEVIGMLPYDVTLTALERTVGWFKVDYHGARGWIAAMYVEPQGNCG